MASFTDGERDSHVLDWSILRDGGIALYRQYRYLDEDLEWFTQHHYQVISFACSNWTSLAAMHGDLAERLSFPAYYGKNFDALNDCVQEDLAVPDAGGLVLVFRGFKSFSVNTSPAHTLLDVLARAVRFHSLLGRRLIVLIQTDDPDYAADGLGCVAAQWNRREWLRSARS